MKFKTTKKAIRSEYAKIIKVGYCNAHFLLKYDKPIAYSTRAEGWACDYYDVNNVLISTGYAPIENKGTKANYEMIHEYDKKAREISEDYSLTYEQQSEKVKKILSEFVKKA